MIRQPHSLIKIFPSVVQCFVGWRPGVQIKSLPKAAIIPVTTTNGNHSLVGGEGIEVVNAAISALQTLAFLVASDLQIQITDGI